MTVYVLRTVWRQFLFFLHNLAVYVVVVLVFFGSLDHPYRMVQNGTLHPGIDWTIILAIPAFALLAVNAVWVALLFGIIATRFRDIPPVINSLIQLVFFMTPIVWTPDVLLGGSHSGWKTAVAEFNPLYHYLEIVRAPLLGQVQSVHHWIVVGVLTVVGSGLALLALRNYRARVSYWV
jgi:ABC-2 type transport system permease protein